MSLRHRRSIVAFAVLIVTACMGVAAADDCPTSVTFEPTAEGTIEAGWTGIDHHLPIAGLTLQLALDCPVSTTPCGTCTIAGLFPQLYPQRCRNDSSKTCTFETEAADCGPGGSCTTFLSPPQSLGSGGIPFCYTTEIAGTVAGSVDVETGLFDVQVPIRSEVRYGVHGPSFGGGSIQACPRCVGDPVANDGNRDGTCDAGDREGFTCDANALSSVLDFGASSFDCPATYNGLVGTFTSGSIAATSAPQSRTLMATSPKCSGTTVPCFCGTCNNAASEACSSNADCPPSGGNPGICNGKRCLGGPNNGAPCSTGSHCPAGICGVPGETTKPHACQDDSTTPNGPADDCSPTGECVLGPVNQHCSNHTERGCSSDAACDDVPGACVSFQRACFTDNGVVGATLSVNGSSTPPVGGIADPTNLASLACLRPTTSNTLNVIGGFPGLLRLEQPGRLVFGSFDEPIPTPVPTSTAPATPVPTPNGHACPAMPQSCRGSVAPQKSKLLILDKYFDAKDKLTWQWNVGAATTIAELGNPILTTGYDLCLYDFFGLRAGMPIPAGGLCDGKACWRPQRLGFKYRNRAGSLGGITDLQLKAGVEDKAKIRAQGAGAALPFPNLGALTGTVQVQLRNRESGLCFGTTFIPPFDKLESTVSTGTLKDRAD